MCRDRKKKLPWVLESTEKANRKMNQENLHNSSQNEVSFQTLQTGMII
jgi:hypothetical protein